MTHPTVYLEEEGDSLQFPGVSAECAQWLIARRKIAEIGINLHGVDGGKSEEFFTGKLLVRAGAFHLENLNNLDAVSEMFLLLGVLLRFRRTC
ncbi:hypothetical protein IX53_05035 [Kosmotoga pacifica]|uniref:Uncharacterized protein n=1 Tax=Kosmotoga pacifica TaxID=1330330 RepID=A0A0G2ZEL4_9BACT|nr:hypothetical protein IX53_05035 [Kosmotoga pacifica]